MVRQVAKCIQMNTLVFAIAILLIAGAIVLFGMIEMQPWNRRAVGCLFIAVLIIALIVFMVEPIFLISLLEWLGFKVWPRT